MRAALVAFAVLRFGLKLELGPEYDTNANRAEILHPAPAIPMGDTPPAPAYPSFLLRSTAAANLSWRAGPNTLRLGGTVGAKQFFASPAAPQDVVVAEAALDDQVTSGAVELGLGGDYYDATQWRDCPDVVTATVTVPDRSCHRDFRSGGPRLHARAALGDHSLSIGAGERSFRWKPDSALSFDAPTVDFAAALRWNSGTDDREREWDLALAGRVEVRDYYSRKLRDANDPGSPDAGPRLDVDTVLSLSLTHVGPLAFLGGRNLLAQVGYLLDDNASNSYGQSYLRHLVLIKLGLDLPWRVVATLKLQLAFTSYAQPAAVTSGMIVPLTVEDETRDALVIDLDRAVGAGFSVGARYSLYRNGASNATIEYTRHVVFVGATYRLRK